MKQFLSIVLREQFTLFYRSGYTFLLKSGLLEFDGVITDETKSEIKNQFKKVTPFYYDEEYIILQFEKLFNENEDFIKFEIQDLVKIYPLSIQAKDSISSKIDERIRLEKPIFETVLPQIELNIYQNEVKIAISALWKICKIEKPLERYISVINFDNIFKGIEHRKNGTKTNKISNGSYWEYLIAYERYDYFPNTTLGYFYDSGQVFAHSKQLPTFEGSTLHNFLEHLNNTNPTIKLPDIIKILESGKELQGYVSQTTTVETKNYIIAPLYLMLRNEIRDSEDVGQTKLFKNLEYLKKFEDSFFYSIILLGAFFGFKKFYDAYYEELNLRFFKNYRYSKEKSVANQEGKSISERKKTQREPVKTKFSESENTPKEQKIENKEKANSDFHEEIKSEIAKQDYNTKQPFNKVQKDNKYRDIRKNTDINSRESSDHENETKIRFKAIINESLNSKPEVRLSEIRNKIKEKTGQSVTNTIIRNVINTMDNIELFKKKNTPFAKQRTSKDLFNNQK